MTGLCLEMLVRAQDRKGPVAASLVGWGGGGSAGTVPREAAEHIEALAVAPVQVQAEDRWEDKHHGCKVTANHYGRLGDGQEGHKAG